LARILPHLLYDVPDLAERNLQSSFDAFPWKRDDSAWQRGRTGYPIVDAGMRELWRTGVMHNRVRMVVASFLVKHLLIDWREGEKGFGIAGRCDTAASCQTGSWVAGSGADAAPYFRVFNRSCQGQKYPDGDYYAGAGAGIGAAAEQDDSRAVGATPLELASARR